jgi:hypothetical protein
VVNFTLCLPFNLKTQKSLNKRFITCIYKRVKVERNIIHTIKRRMANWIAHVLRRNCLLKHVTEGDMEGTGRRGGRRKQLPGDLKKNIGYLNLRGSTSSSSSSSSSSSVEPGG